MRLWPLRAREGGGGGMVRGRATYLSVAREGAGVARSRRHRPSGAVASPSAQWRGPLAAGRDVAGV